MSEQRPVPEVDPTPHRTPLQWLLWGLRKAGLILLGAVLYLVAINTFAGYPQIHSELLNWIAVVAMCLAGLITWIRSERRRDP